MICHPIKVKLIEEDKKKLIAGKSKELIDNNTLSSDLILSI